jgi:hypothetical protein
LWFTGAKHGTVKGPQWMKIPNLASSYHCGSGRPANGWDGVDPALTTAVWHGAA